MTRRVAVTVFLSIASHGCGLVAYDGLTSSDASADSSAESDALSACAAWGPWGAAVPVGIGAADPEEREDGLEMWGVQLGSGYDIFRAARTSPGDDYGAFATYDQLNGPATSNDQDPALTADGLEIFFISNRSGAYRGYHATRNSPAEEFGPPELIPGLEAVEADAIDVLPDGLTLYINQQLGNTVVRAHRPNSGAAFVVEETFPFNASFLTIAADELELMYVEDPDLGYRARTMVGDPFVAQPSFDVGLVEEDPDFSADGTELLFTAGGDIYRVSRACL